MKRSEDRTLSAEEKLELVLASYGTENVAEFCRQHGIDRSYLYRLRREHRKAALSMWSSRQPGRPRKEDALDPAALLAELESARQTVGALEEKTKQLTVRTEVQDLLLQMAEYNVQKKRSGSRRDST